MKYPKLFILFMFLTTSCRLIFTGEFKQASLPKQPAPSLPEKTFESFWQTFEDQYAFFTLRQVDWHASYKKFRPRVTAATSDDSLFNILSDMVRPFQDEHINLVFPHGISYQEFTSSKPSHFLQEFPDKKAQKNFWQMVDKTLIVNGFGPQQFVGPKDDGIPLFTYSLSADVGYLRFTRCYASGKTEDDESGKDEAIGGAQLDIVLKKLSKTQRIIIDVRSNEGGNDKFSYAVAGRFTSQKTIGHFKQYRTGGYEDFSPLQAWYIEPKGIFYDKPVTLLINDQTCSAAEVFATAMKALPQTIIVGDNSMGIYSDMYGFKLPNGWYVSLSNERYFSADMKCYEVIGTPVDLKILNTKNDILTLKDPVITAALTR